MCTINNRNSPLRKPAKSRRATVEQAKVQQMELVHFITRDSIKFFDIISGSSSFLKQHPSTWEANPEYQSACNVIKHLKVVNDAAKRGVRLMSEYNNILTKDNHGYL